MAKKYKKGKKGKSSPAVSIREDRNEEEFLMVRGRTMPRGKSGLTVFVRHGRYGGFRMGMGDWTPDKPLINVNVPDGNVEYNEDEGEFVIKIPIKPLDDKFDEDKITDWLEGSESDEDDEDDDDEDDEEEEEEEEKPRRKSKKTKRKKKFR